MLEIGDTVRCQDLDEQVPVGTLLLSRDTGHNLRIVRRESDWVWFDQHRVERFDHIIVDEWEVLYLPPRPPAKVGDEYRDREELEELPEGAVIVDVIGDACVLQEDGDWLCALVDDGGIAFPATLVHLPGAA